MVHDWCLMVEIQFLAYGRCGIGVRISRLWFILLNFLVHDWCTFLMVYGIGLMLDGWDTFLDIWVVGFDRGISWVIWHLFKSHGWHVVWLMVLLMILIHIWNTVNTLQWWYLMIYYMVLMYIFDAHGWCAWSEHGMA